MPEPMLMVVQRNICSCGPQEWMNVGLKLLRRGRCSLWPQKFVVDTSVEVVFEWLWSVGTRLLPCAWNGASASQTPGIAKASLAVAVGSSTKRWERPKMMQATGLSLDSTNTFSTVNEPIHSSPARAVS